MSDRRINGHACGTPAVDPATWGTPSTMTGRIKPKCGESASDYAERQAELVSRNLHRYNDRRRQQKIALEKRNAKAYRLANPPESVVTEIDRMQASMRAELDRLAKNGVDATTLRRVEENRRAAIELYWKQWYVAQGAGGDEGYGDLLDGDGS